MTQCNGYYYTCHAPCNEKYFELSIRRFATQLTELNKCLPLLMGPNALKKICKKEMN